MEFLICIHAIRVESSIIYSKETQVEFPHHDVVPSLNISSTWENLSSGVYAQHRRRPACATAQSDHRLCNSLFGKYHM